MSDYGERFWAKVDKSGDCWLWTGYKKPDGYGLYRAPITATTRDRSRGDTASVHRIAYELLVGPIPEGLTLDHLCRTRACVNPDHLEPVTNRENVLRGDGLTAQNARKTHCIRGHEFTPENTYRHSRGRTCRECRRQLNREAAALKRAA